MANLKKSGINNDAERIRYASQIHGLGKASAEVPAQAVAPVEAPEPKKTFLDNARTANEYTPSARAGGGGDSAPQVQTEGDLDNLWLKQYRAVASA